MAKRDSVKKSRELKMNYAFYVHELYTKRVPRSAPLPVAFVRDGLDSPSSALLRLWEVAAAAARRRRRGVRGVAVARTKYVCAEMPPAPPQGEEEMGEKYRLSN